MTATIAPLYPTQKVVARRHPLFPPVTVTAVHELAPGVWRFDWECVVRADCTPVTGSAQAAGYVRAGGGP